jgi:hypothetical protein
VGEESEDGRFEAEGEVRAVPVVADEAGAGDGLGPAMIEIELADTTVETVVDF